MVEMANFMLYIFYNNKKFLFQRKEIRLETQRTLSFNEESKQLWIWRPTSPLSNCFIWGRRLWGPFVLASSTLQWGLQQPPQRKALCAQHLTSGRYTTFILLMPLNQIHRTLASEEALEVPSASTLIVQMTEQGLRSHCGLLASAEPASRFP